MQTRLWLSATALISLILALTICAPRALSQSPPQPIPAIQAFQAPACGNSDLSNNTDLDRGNPEWKAIVINPLFPLPDNPTTILEGVVPPPPDTETSSDQAHSEVSEEELPWNHATHDFTFKVVPDGNYANLLSSWVNADGSIGVHGDMEVEWENASLMDESPEGFQRTWGAAPEFVWPGVGDRIWVEGRWIFDCGHPSSSDVAHVEFSTEIHPPRALVTFRQLHPALDTFPRPRVSAPNFPGPQSYLPVTGVPTTLPPDVPNSGPTRVPLTEADIYVSGNGGLVNDLCSMTPYDLPFFGCPNHSGPYIPVNDRNYVFDIYPPGTCFSFFTCPLINGTFPVASPTPSAALQWRVVDHFSELPARACGGTDNSSCITVQPILCLIDSATPPPTQAETSCPAVPAQPTRLRVILPFCSTASLPCSSDANYFAQSILLGWDDVPSEPASKTVRTFQVALNKLTVVQNLGGFSDGDWRVFVNVGGQYRYMSAFFDTDANNNGGIFNLDGGNNVCHGDALTSNGNNDCFQFNNTPFTVSIVDGTPIHVAVGGYQADHSLEGDFCHTYSGCDFSFGSGADLAIFTFHRIGTYEFDLLPPDYTPPPAFTTEPIVANLRCVSPGACDFLSGMTEAQQLSFCSQNPTICIFITDGVYTTQFTVNELPFPVPPASSPLATGNPSYNGPGGTFVSSATPITLSATDPNVQGFQYRSYPQGAALPVYASPQPFPVHWTQANFPTGGQSVQISLAGSDGPNVLQYSAESFAQLLEPRHTATLILDNTPPAITILQPQPTPYVHSATLTLNYSITDSGAGVASFTPTMDGAVSLPGNLALQNSQPIKLLTELSLGPHTFAIKATDNVGNVTSTSVSFTIIVTAQSVLDDVNQLVGSGDVSANQSSPLLAKLTSAANARANGNCANAASIYQSFIADVNAQTGKKIDATAAAILIADAQYLIAHCP